LVGWLAGWLVGWLAGWLQFQSLCNALILLKLAVFVSWPKSQYFTPEVRYRTEGRYVVWTRHLSCVLVANSTPLCWGIA
jgi:hypothetical protein